MEIYDDPAMALIFSIVESSTNHRSSDEQISKVIEDSLAKFKLQEKPTKDKTTGWMDSSYYNKYKEHMDTLYIYTFAGGTIKDFCNMNSLSYQSVLYAYKYYRELNGIATKRRKK
jgi:hypothetical protein